VCTPIVDPSCLDSSRKTPPSKDIKVVHLARDLIRAKIEQAPLHVLIMSANHDTTMQIGPLILSGSSLKSRLRTKAWVGRVDWREGPTSRYLLPPFKSINKLHVAATSTQLFRNYSGLEIPHTECADMKYLITRVCVRFRGSPVPFPMALFTPRAAAAAAAGGYVTPPLSDPGLIAGPICICGLPSIGDNT
jgi:hypothetical protein